MKPSIEYQLHDSLLTALELGPRKELRLTISLYPNYYPGERPVILRFGGILNMETVSKFAGILMAGFEENAEFTWRIDSFAYDAKRHSTTDDLHFCLEIDQIGALTIHCSKLTFNQPEL